MGKGASRPIIFIGHSYGGLVIKEVCYLKLWQGGSTFEFSHALTCFEALNQANSGPATASSFPSNVKGIVFLGTPHRGTVYSSYGRILAILLNRLSSNPDVFLSLAVNSSVLLEQHQKFLTRYANLTMINFFETRKSVLWNTPIFKFPAKGMVCNASQFSLLLMLM
jgi:triacylglycerol esterase/lipase EstA (alpha/beta hydrolase family)